MNHHSVDYAITNLHTEEKRKPVGNLGKGPLPPRQCHKQNLWSTIHTKHKIHTQHLEQETINDHSTVIELVLSYLKLAVLTEYSGKLLVISIIFFDKSLVISIIHITITTEKISRLTSS